MRGPEKIVDYITTSGTLGDPVTFGCTDHDLDRLAYNEMKSFSCAGLKPGNIVQLMTTLDKRFMADLHTSLAFVNSEQVSSGLEMVCLNCSGTQLNVLNRIQ